MGQRYYKEDSKSSSRVGEKGGDRIRRNRVASF